MLWATADPVEVKTPGAVWACVGRGQATEIVVAINNAAESRAINRFVSIAGSSLLDRIRIHSNSALPSEEVLTAVVTEGSACNGCK